MAAKAMIAARKHGVTLVGVTSHITMAQMVTMQKTKNLAAIIARKVHAQKVKNVALPTTS
jgi:hypothetical protein